MDGADRVWTVFQIPSTLGLVSRWIALVRSRLDDSVVLNFLLIRQLGRRGPAGAEWCQRHGGQRRSPRSGAPLELWSGEPREGAGRQLVPRRRREGSFYCSKFHRGAG